MLCKFTPIYVKGNLHCVQSDCPTVRLSDSPIARQKSFFTEFCWRKRDNCDCDIFPSSYDAV